jgi:hypothetical protein
MAAAFARPAGHVGLCGDVGIVASPAVLTVGGWMVAVLTGVVIGVHGFS